VHREPSWWKRVQIFMPNSLACPTDIRLRCNLCTAPAISRRLPGRSATLPAVDEGLYESLLTERLQQALAAEPDLRTGFGAVDEAEQPLTLTRHLTGLFERALRTAGTPSERAELVRAVLAVLPDPDLLTETPHEREPGRIERLEAVTAAGRLTAVPPRPATPLSRASSSWRPDRPSL
jgi:hypothetical protein